MVVNVVELISPDDNAFDQPCRFGNRVDGHAVYCHNDAWADGPRKCRRTWYTGGETKDEDCPGFEPNPEFEGAPSPSLIAQPVCTACGGSRLKVLNKTKETCRRCMGEGSEPLAIELSVYEQDTLEMGVLGPRRDWFTRIAETDEQSKSVLKVSELGLIDLRSMSWTKAGATVFLVRLTGKGDATLRANWKAQKALSQ